MKLIFLLLLVMLLSTSVGRAQNDGLTPIFTYTNGMPPAENHIDFAESEWQFDSQGFNFRYAMSEKSLQLRYVIATNELVATERRFPCAMEFSQTQLKAFGALRCPQSLSPNGRYIVYATKETICDEECYPKVALGNLETGTHSIIKKDIDTGYFIRWSANSAAFLIMDYDPISVLNEIWHVEVPQNLLGRTDIEATRLAMFILGDMGYIDISADGHRVLVQGDENRASGLTLWDTKFPTTYTHYAAWENGRKLLSDKRIAGAAFVSDDPQHILAVTNEGVILFDLETEMSTVLHPAINSNWANWVYFSPDRHYALVFVDKPNGTASQHLSLFQLN